MSTHGGTVRGRQPRHTPPQVVFVSDWGRGSAHDVVQWERGRLSSAKPGFGTPRVPSPHYKHPFPIGLWCNGSIPRCGRGSLG